MRGGPYGPPALAATRAIAVLERHTVIDVARRAVHDVAVVVTKRRGGRRSGLHGGPG